MVNNITSLNPLFEIIDYDPKSEIHINAVNKLRREYKDFGQHPFIDSDLEFLSREAFRSRRYDLYRRRIVILNGEIVATGSCNQIDKEKEASVRYCTIIVKSSHSRRGIGSALLQSLAEHPAPTASRPSIQIASYDPRGEAFARKHGFEQSGVYVESIAVRDRDEVREAFMRRKSAVRSTGLEVKISSIGPMIEEQDISDFMQLYTCSVIEGHSNKTPHSSRLISYKKYCEYYRISWMYGEEHYWAVARSSDGEPVGMTVWNWRPEDPTSSMGIIIGVRPSARGHGLANLLRAAVFERIQSVHANVSRFRTQSVSGNLNMLKLNSRAGYSEQRSIRVFERYG